MQGSIIVFLKLISGFRIMETSIKVLFWGFIGLVLFASCSKDNDNPTFDNTQKNIAIECSYTGLDPSFRTGLSIKLYGEDVSRTEVKGIEWSEIVVDDNKNGVQFLGEIQVTDEVFRTVRLETSAPVWGCTTITTFGSEDINSDNPVSVVVKYYIENRLVKTDEFNPSSDNFYTYNEQLMVADH